jgi:hypothetical protein
MNHSIYSADRATHVKIVIVALVVGILGAGLGLSVRPTLGDSQTAVAIKVGKPVVTTRADAAVIR